MDFDDLFLRRIFMIIAMKRAQRYNFHISKVNKVIDKIITTIENDVNNHFLATSKDDRELMVSFAPKSEFKYNDEKRMKTTLDKYIRRELNINYSDINEYNLERFCKSVMSVANGNLKHITVYSGKELKEYFKGINTDAKKISNKEVLFYSANDGKVSWVVSSNFARALLWNCDDGTKLLDEVYPKNKNYNKQIIDWANKNNIKTISDLTVSELYKLRITMKCRFINEIPPQDTFKYAELNKNDGEKIIIAADPSFGNLNIGAKYKPYYKQLLCKVCGKSSSDSGILSKIEGGWYCSECITKNFKFCNCCLKYKPIIEIGYNEEGYSKYNRDQRFTVLSGWICDSCIGNSTYFNKCYVCNEYFHEKCMAKTTMDYSTKNVCKECLKKYVDKCSKCYKVDVVVNKYGKILCLTCVKGFVKCQFCNVYDSKYSMSSVIIKGKSIEGAICDNCREGKERCQGCWCYLIDTPYYEIIESHYAYQTKQVYCEKCKNKNEERIVIYNKYKNQRFCNSGYIKTEVKLKEPDTSKSTLNIVKSSEIHSNKECKSKHPGYLNKKHGYYGMN